MPDPLKTSSIYRKNVREFTLEHKPDIAISESWLNSTVTNAEIEIEGFKVIRLDRLHKIGGGVCIRSL